MGALEVERPRLHDFVFLGISSSLGPVAFLPPNQGVIFSLLNQQRKLRGGVYYLLGLNNPG